MLAAALLLYSKPRNTWKTMAKYCCNRTTAFCSKNFCFMDKDAKM